MMFIPLIPIKVQVPREIPIGQIPARGIKLSITQPAQFLRIRSEDGYGYEIDMFALAVNFIYIMEHTGGAQWNIVHPAINSTKEDTEESEFCNTCGQLLQANASQIVSIKPEVQVMMKFHATPICLPFTAPRQLHELVAKHPTDITTQ